MIIDYTEQYQKHHPNEKVIMAEGEKDLFLALIKLDHPVKRFDGKMGKYLLKAYTLSCECENPEDEAYTCVVGDDYTYHRKNEIDFNKQLFKQFAFIG